MKKHRKIQQISLAILLTGFFMGAALAGNDKNEQRNPLGCLDVGYQFELKTLNLLPKEAGERNSLYFLRNKSNQRVNLYQMRELDGTRSMYLNHDIAPDRWAVLSTCEKEIKYICTIDDRKSSYGKIVDCANHLQVCEYARVRFGVNNRGNHWIVNGNTRNGAVREVVHYGIIPQ